MSQNTMRMSADDSRTELRSHERSANSDMYSETTTNKQPRQDDSIDAARETESESVHSIGERHQGSGSITVIGIEPLLSLAQLNEGDGLLWGDRSQPLLVSEASIDRNSAVSLEGPLGGEYSLQHHDDTFVVLSKYGQISNPVRVKTTNKPSNRSNSEESKAARRQPVSSEA